MSGGRQDAPSRGDLERAAALLDADPAYRVTRALPPLDALALPEPEGWVRTALVVDTETTSLDVKTGRIIQVAACPVRFDQRARVVGIGGNRSWMEDPGEPLSPEISRLTGLIDSDLAGQRIDDEAVTAMLTNADVVVAHNAAFDRPWWEKRFPIAAEKAWCCTLKEVDWRCHGFEGRSLGVLLDQAGGWFNTRHRADADVDALVALMTATLPSGHTVATEALLTAHRPSVRVRAVGAPFHLKDRLRQRGYRWNADLQVWQTEVSEAQSESERAWLVAEAECHAPQLSPITWHTRHR